MNGKIKKKGWKGKKSIDNTMSSVTEILDLHKRSEMLTSLDLDLDLKFGLVKWSDKKKKIASLMFCEHDLQTLHNLGIRKW